MNRQARAAGIAVACMVLGWPVFASGPILGVNEAISVPRAWIDRKLIAPEKEFAELLKDARLTRELGATMVRANSPVYPYLDMQSMERSGWDWTRPDRWVKVIGQVGLDAIVVLGPWPGNRTAAYTPHYVPKDLSVYKDYVRRVVERYDGDGQDDMPGLMRPIKVWEVDNEPDLHNSVPPKGGPALGDPDFTTFETPTQYARVLKATSEAIRQADPEARVFSGGMYRPHTAKGRKYLSEVLAVEGTLAAIDGLSLHCYSDNNDLDAVERTMKTARDLAPNLPVWITETSVPANEKKEWMTSQWQGMMVAGIVGAALAHGAEAIFWHTLADPPGSGKHARRSAFATNSLLQTTAPPGAGRIAGPGGIHTPKPAGDVFQRLAKLLASVDRAQIQEVPAKGGRLLWTGEGWLAFWGEPRLPGGASSVLDLRTGKVTTRTTAPAPAWIPVGKEATVP